MSAETSGGDGRVATGGRPSRRGLIGAGIDRVAGTVVPAVVRTVDADELIQRIDVGSLMDRVDVNALLDRVDPQRLLDRVDVNRLLDRVDIDGLLDRADLQHLLDRIDIDALLERVDLGAVVERTEIGDIIAQSTGQVAGNTLDLLRRQFVGLDLVSNRVVNRLLRRDPATMPAGPAALVASADGP